MKSVLFRLPALLLIAGLFTLASCSKDSDADFSSSESETWSLDASENIDEMADNATFGRTEGGGGGGIPGLAQGNCSPLENLPECATVTESGDAYPKTITIDFGDGCAGDRGREKSGQLIITLTAPMEEEGAIRSVAFDNFAVNGNPVIGSRVTTNIGTQEAGYLTFSKEVNMTIETPRGMMTRTFSGTKQWVAGFDTETCDDNVFLVSGSGSGTCHSGSTRTMTITTPLLVDRTCGYPTQGVIENTSEERSGTIDFGDGTCDNLAVVTKDGESREINLDEHRAKRGRMRK